MNVDLLGDPLQERPRNVHFSSNTDRWSTPAEVFAGLNKKYDFTLDPCADGENATCSKYFTVFEDGLTKPWAPHRVFMNPPYSQVADWMAKGWGESRRGAFVVCLVPSRTDSAWWHDYAMRGEITFIRGRLRFGNAKNFAPFPSAIVVFKAGRAGEILEP